jgi:tryptophanyl-tRNA synthetase
VLSTHVTATSPTAASPTAASLAAASLDTLPRTTRLSGFKPTGRLHLGNYLGAIRPMVGAQSATDSIVMIADLHALTVEHDPARLRALTREVLATLLATGVDPDTTLCYVQSDVPEHAELHYLLECATGYGEAARMIQFRERAAGREHVRLSLLTYPVLMAADILLYDADEVPVGEDQTQHVELARDVANRFNTRYGRTFVVPKAVNPPVAARVMDLGDPLGKMGKSSTSEGGLVYLLDPPEAIRRKVNRAVTDPDGTVAYDPYRRPGLANLLEIAAACGRGRPDEIAARHDSYSGLKNEVAESIVDALAPVQERYRTLVAQPDRLDAIRREGADRARDRAGHTLRRAKRAIGLST